VNRLVPARTMNIFSDASSNTRCYCSTTGAQ